MAPQRAAKQNQRAERQQSGQSSTANRSGQDSSQGRRNRLNYHRAAVACVHCRKRKIRCELPANKSGSCENCIRQRKNCWILSVDQQADRERATFQPEDTGTPGLSPLVLTSSAESMTPEEQTVHNGTFAVSSGLETTLPPTVPGSYTDYSPHGNILPGGMDGHTGFHSPLPLLQSEAPAHATAAATTMGWHHSTMASLSPYTAHEPLPHQHQLSSQHNLFAQHHGQQNAFQPVLRSNNGTAEAPWSHASTTETTDGPGNWTYPLPPSM